MPRSISQTAYLREQEKLDGSVGPVLMTPKGNEEVHGDKHQLPEEIEKEEVERQKDPDYTCDCPCQVEVKEPHPLPYLRPRGDGCHDSEKAGEHDKKKTYTVDGQVKAYTQTRNPWCLYFNKPRTVGC